MYVRTYRYTCTNYLKERTMVPVVRTNGMYKTFTTGMVNSLRTAVLASYHGTRVLGTVVVPTMVASLARYSSTMVRYTFTIRTGAH